MIQHQEVQGADTNWGGNNSNGERRDPSAAPLHPNPSLMEHHSVPTPFMTQQHVMSSPNWAPATPVPITTGAPAAAVSFPPAVQPSPIMTSAGAPTFHVGSSGATNSARSTSSSSRRKTSSKESTAADKSGGPVSERRQKRLERNRESARLSRRRRKQYLEVLEERVTQLSEDMDKGRRVHVAEAVPTLRQKRREALERGDLHALETRLDRTGVEMRVAATFQTQQLQSLSLPPHIKFLLWLTLQTDTYFRGGRAASERLSAARIGERMLCSGNDKVSPSQGMWPLICNEVGLSYDQEERLRNFQRSLLQFSESWLHRHTAYASGRVLQSSHDAIQGVYNTISQRERRVKSVLTETQRYKFLLWAEQNRDRIAHKIQSKPQQPVQHDYSISLKNHDAANLYILNHRLEKVLRKLVPAPVLMSRANAKRLSRRASFESLGSSSSLAERKEETRSLSREVSFSSSGSLKRSASELEMDDERSLSQGVSPEDAQAAAQPTIEAVLGFIRELLPSRPSPQPDKVESNMPPPPAPAPSAPQSHTQPVHHPPSQPLPPPLAAPALDQPMEVQQPTPVTSFLPPPLNVVPEDALLQGQSADGADDFLFELTEEDWAIGEGFEMDDNS